MYECPHPDCNATMRGKREYDEHFKTHPKPFRYQCKHPIVEKSQTEDNPQLGHTLADTRNHHIAGQSSVGQQDRSSNEYPLEKFNIIDDLDGSIFDDLNIPDDVVVEIEDINIDDSDIFDGVVF
uniref:C2H2-type domain-containing protein n=1 Tax=Loa loa TaxID=7209 RepID=A0A1I7VBV4_LOALO